VRVDVNDTFHGLFVAGCVLLPFSTGPESGGVLSFGLPFFVLAALLVPPILARNAARIDGGAVLLATCFVALIVASTVFSLNRGPASVRAAVNLVGFLVFLGRLAMVAFGRYPAQRLARICMLSCAVLSAYFIVNFALAASSHGIGAVILERYVGGAMSLPWGASNTIAQVLLLAFVAYTTLEDPGPRDKAAMVLASCAILLTFSRSVGMLMLLMWAIVFGLRRTVIFAGCVTGGVAALFSAGVLEASRFEAFLASRLNPEKLMTAGGRFDTMAEKLGYFLANPTEPIGYYASLSVFDLSAHNYWLTTLVEQSFAAVVVSLLFFVYIWAKALFKKPNVALAFMVVMLALMIEDPHFTQPYIMLFWSIVALVVSFEGRPRRGLVEVAR